TDRGRVQPSPDPGAKRSARAFARATGGAFRRRQLRPFGRHPGEPAPAQDGGRSTPAEADPSGAQRRLPVHAGDGGRMRRFLPQTLPAWVLLVVITGLLVSQVTT